MSSFLEQLYHGTLLRIGYFMSQDLSVSVRESPVEVWVDSGLLWVRDIDCSNPWRHSWHKFFWRRLPLPYHSFASDQNTRREHSPTPQKKLD